VWQTNPGVLSHEQCLRSGDPILSAFARARRKLPDYRPAPGEAGRWLLLGPLRAEDPDQTLRHTCRVRL
jgi:hypothetical protein